LIIFIDTLFDATLPMPILRYLLPTFFALLLLLPLDDSRQIPIRHAIRRLPPPDIDIFAISSRQPIHYAAARYYYYFSIFRHATPLLPFFAMPLIFRLLSPRFLSTFRHAHFRCCRR
jgi:hypothetical protein